MTQRIDNAADKCKTVYSDSSQRVAESSKLQEKKKEKEEEIRYRD